MGAAVMGCANAGPAASEPVRLAAAIETPLDMRAFKAEVWSQIEGYAGDDMRDLFTESMSVAKQLRRGTAMPDQETQPEDGARVGPGWVFLTGCRPHYCPEKAAVVATRDGAPLAAGVIYYTSRREGAGRGAPHLFVAVFADPLPEAAALVLEGWARNHFADIVIEAPIVYSGA
jgi:hypothetical protein